MMQFRIYPKPSAQRLCTTSRVRQLFACGALVLLAIATSDRAAAEAIVAPAVRSYQGTRLTGTPPVIDGHLDDACWQGLGTWTGDFVQREPREGAKASLPTELKVLYDDTTIYVAIRAYDPDIASRPRTMGGRDEFTGEMVGINFDSYHDRRFGFEFDVTSGGSKIDLLLRDDGSVDLSWNAVWDVKTAIERDAWTAEFRIPLSQLRYLSGAEQIWGMHSWRWLARQQEESDWNLIPMDNHGWVHSFGELRGLNNLPTPLRLEVAPYVIAKTRRYAAESGNPFRTGRDSKIDGGLDLKYGLGSNFTLDATVNPDFSQVDADPSEINLTTVETFRSERRPFFLEGKDAFAFPLDDDSVFYSRRIGDAPHLDVSAGAMHDVPEANRILGSAKLTGTTRNGLTIGLLHAVVDRTTMRVVDATGERRVTAEPGTNDSVVRLRQDLAEGNTRVGAVFSSRLRRGDDDELQTLPRRSFTYGTDAAQYFSDRNYLVEARLLGTTISGSPESITALMESPAHNYQRTDADYLETDPLANRLSGNAGYVRAGRIAGTWRGQGFVSWRSPGTDFNDLGYMQTADFITPGGQIQYYDASAGSLLRRRDVRLKFTQPQNYGGEVLSRKVKLEAEFATISGAYFSVASGIETALLDTHVLRGGPALRLANRYPLYCYFETPAGRPLQFKFTGEASTSDEAGALTLRSAPGVEWKPVDRFRAGFTVDYSRERQPTQYAGVATGGASPVYVMGHLDQQILAGTCKMNVNFNPAVSLSYYGGPFVTTGHYDQFKAVAHPRAASTADRYDALSSQSAASGHYEADYRGAHLEWNDPDFNWREFKSNLVLRWEYRPGSSVYCVWSQYRSDAADIGGFSAAPQYERLFSAHPDNTLLIKLSYWFSI